ncbi:MAG: hypothetical protein LBM75_09900 [Myxococcales bacterium]|jgi:alanyl-tRNA synthetase|nr:hypothetical protein [Myxococcales bacterium]
MSDSLMALASRAAREALRDFLSDDTRAAGVARAAVQIQKARYAALQAQENLLHELGFATKSDYDSLVRQAARLKRRARRLRDELERHAANAGKISENPK